MNNKTLTIGTLFSGGEGVGIGARQAGLDHLWGVEYDDSIAQVARNNGFHTITGNVMDKALMLSLPRPDVLHASPVCKNASNAKTDGEESPEDIASADAVCDYLDHFRPDIFTLENVYGYRTFTAFAHIIECLNRNGYRSDYWHLNAADYGVPQTRQRLILVARLHGKPRKPIATHARADKLTPLFDDRLPWVGWYKAIEDLIDTLPASQFAQWQLDRLPDELQSIIFQPSFPNGNRIEKFRRIDQPYDTVDTTVLGRTRAFILDGQANDRGASGNACAADDPIFTMTGSMDRRPARAFIPPFVNADGTAHEQLQDEPIQTLQGTAYKQTPKAFLVESKNANQEYGDGLRSNDEPATTVVTDAKDSHIPKAFIAVVNGANSDYLEGDEPSLSITNQANGRLRAYLFGNNANGADIYVPVDEPAQTLRTSTGGRVQRAWLNNGRVVKMTSRALARFQSFPDSYILPDKAKLACTVIGNAVPPLLYQRVIEAQIGR